MTAEEFYKAADIWYNRMVSLRRIMVDENEPAFRRIRSSHLYIEMHGRMKNVIDIAIEQHIKLGRDVKFEKGGYINN